MPGVDTQLGGGYVYQWDCATLMALDYFGQPVGFVPALHDLITGFLGQVTSLVLEGGIQDYTADGESQKRVELEDINLTAGNRRILIQVKAKEDEAGAWTPSDDLLLKALYRFCKSPLLADQPEETRFVFLTNRQFNAALVRVKDTKPEDLRQRKEAKELYPSLERYAQREKKAPVDEQLFWQMLERTTFVQYLHENAVKANVKAKLQALGRSDCEAAQATIFEHFTRQSVRSGGGWITPQSFRKVLAPARPGISYPRLCYADSVEQLLNFYTVAFVGRAQELDRIVAFTHQADGGYLFVQGPAGFGKSALLAHVVRTLQTVPGPPRLLYFFVRPEGEQDTPVAFLQAINSQLLDLLNVEGGVPADLNSLRGQFGQLWQQASAAATIDQPLVLMVDGLDAMKRGRSTIADVLPPQPGAYVHIVVSARPDKALRSELEVNSVGSEATEIKLDALGEAEVWELLCQYGLQPEQATELAPRVHAGSEGGNPLLVRFMAQAVAQDAKAILASLEAKPPAGVGTYFQQEFDRLGDTAAGQAAWDILGLLVLSPAGLAPDDIGELVGLGRRSEVQRSLTSIRRFLVGEDILELSQRQLRELVLADLYSHKQTEYRQRLLRWCQAYQDRGWPAATPTRVLMHYASLLHSAGQEQELYELVLDDNFRKAQLDRLSDAFVTLSDLRMTLDLALRRDDLLVALRCVTAYRQVLQSGRLTKAVFAAVDGQDHQCALRGAGQFRSLPVWSRAMMYYLSWEAAEAGAAEAASRAIKTGEAMPSSSMAEANELCDALLVRACLALADRNQSGLDAESQLTQWRGAKPAKALLDKYKLAHLLESTERNSLRSQLSQLRGKQRGKDRVQRWSPDYPGVIRTMTALRSQLAADEETRAELERDVKFDLAFPYPRYRDLNALPLAVACVAAPDSVWVRKQLRGILEKALEREGIIFPFDLASVLRMAAQVRGLPAPEWAADFLDEALASKDLWGTSERARSARATALFWHGQTDEAFDELRKPQRPSKSNAGYETITVLSLANRCYEFGRPDRARDHAWLGSRNDLLGEAASQAEHVDDLQFKRERLALVQAYARWLDQPTPDAETALGTLAHMADNDTRLAYIDHISARWSAPGKRNPDGVKALIPLALMDTTTLDALLGRLVGAALDRLSDADVTEAIRISHLL